MKVAIAMSGGVDSSVATKILKDEGHEVIGLFLKLWSDPTSHGSYAGQVPTSPRIRGASALCNIKAENRCCDYEALNDARAVATKLKIPFYVINARDEFKAEVVDYFLNEYKNLRTPNPCVVCNDKIKFGLLLKRALEIGCDFLATGHYARIEQTQNYNLKLNNCSDCHCEESSTRQSDIRVIPHLPALSEAEGMRDPYLLVDPRFHGDDRNGGNSSPNKLTPNSYKLLAGIDKTKDQSYMLYHLNQKQLSRILFPLGKMTKKDVRALAVKWDLPVKEKPESQEICFFADRDYRNFLKRYLPEKYFKVGEIVDLKGNILGEHQGLINYTIGQRKGVEQTSKSKLQMPNEMTNAKKIDKKPLYVIGLDIKKNQLIVGGDKEVYSKEMIVSNVNWIDPKAESCKLKAKSLSVKIRYRHEAVSCKISKSKMCHCEEPAVRLSRADAHCRGTTKQSVNNTTIQQFNNLLVVFDQPQRAITPGQSAVFYLPAVASAKDGLGDEVLGGGIIV